MMGETQLKKSELSKLIKYMVLTCLFLYIPIIFGKILLVYPDMGYDTYNAYLPQYELIVNKLASGHFSLMDFTYGMGTNAFNMQLFLFDPFSLISVLFGLLFGTKNIAYAIVYMQIIKSIIAGIGCYYYLSEYSFSRKSKTLAAYIFAFSGYMIGAGQHYQFATAPVFVILVLLFIEKSFKNKRYLIALAGIIALTSCWSIFFAFHVIVFSVIYIFIRVFQIIDKITFIGIMKKLLPFASTYILGIMLSGVIFLPSLYQIINTSARTISDVPLLTKIIMSFKLINKDDFKMSFLRFFSENIQGTVNNWTGGPYHFGAAHYFFSVALVLCIPQYIMNSFSKVKFIKEKIMKAIIITLVVFSTTSYFFGYLSNVFATTNWRFVYVLTPLFAIVIADTFDKIYIEKRFNRFANYAILLIGVVSIAIYYDRGSGISSKITVINVLSCLVISSVILDFITTYRGKNKRVTKIAFILISLCIAFNIFSDNIVTIYGGRTFLSKEQLSTTYHDKNISEIVSYLNEKEKNNFYRLEKDFNEATPLFTYSGIERYRSTSTYNSTLNKNTIEFVKQIGNPYVTPGDTLQAYAAGSFGELFDNLVTDNLGIKYLISRNQIDREGWVLEKQFDDLFLYKNEDLDYAGILYENYITTEDFASLSLAEKKLFMADCIVLNDVNKDFNQISKIGFTNISNAIDYDNIVNQNSWIDSKQITGEIIGSSWQDGVYDIPINTKNTNIQNQQNIFKFNIDPKITFDIKVAFDLGKGFNFNQGVDYSQTVYGEQDNSVIIKIPSNAKAVRLIFAQTGFHISDMGILTKGKSYTNESIIFENPNFGGIVSGTVYTQKDSLLYIPIPYEEGWKAYVDEAEAEILQANYGFSAIEVKQGEHKVEFKYTTPWLVPGALLSGLAIIILIIMWSYIRKKTVTM